MATQERKAVVAVTDGGGRGSVIVEAYLKSPHVEKVLVFPGNDMMAEERSDRVALFPGIKTSDVDQIIALSKENGVTHIDICQDNAVQAGVSDAAFLHGIKVIGPTSVAGRIEWDKEYARRLGDTAEIPQPDWVAFSTIREAEGWLDKMPERKMFVKATGLAEGKGSIRASNKQEALDAIKRLKKEHPMASERFLIEKALVGEESSTFAVSDGTNFIVVGSAQDHKHEKDGDKGDMKGGMGAVSNPLLMRDVVLQEGTESNISKMLAAKREEGNPYRGWIFHGGMAIPIGNDRLKQFLLEWNARLGDPEAQVILPGLNIDLLELGDAIVDGDISGLDIRNDGKVRVVVAVASRGYPRSYKAVRNKEVKSLPELRRLDGINIYGAGIKMEESKHYIAGGRLFYIMTEGIDVLEAREKLSVVLEIVEGMDGENVRFRTDIGWRDVERLRQKSLQ
ncbi:MAG: Phosphoribosylamine-glycine ligase [Microgenomates group bacterium GW2011_GWC1_39_7]|nr:MAG: Phosphoribosylamine-glycine ligase [Microgenomates group bacterium GW2011_GWC1_39_7]